MTKQAFKKFYKLCFIALFIAAIISGLSFVAQKIGMKYIEPFTFNTIRCFLGFICLLPIIFFSKTTNNKTNKHDFKGGIITGIILFLALSVNQYCMITADAGKAGFITSLYILFVPLIALFKKVKIEANVILAIPLALYGLFLLCSKNNFTFNLSDIGLVISAFLFGLHIFVLNHYSKKANVLKLSCIQFLVASFLSLILTIIFENPEINNIILCWKPLIFMGFIVTGLSYTLQSFGYKTIKPVIATLILSSEAIFAVLGGCIILDETLCLKEIIGCIIMSFAIIISQVKFGKKIQKFWQKI